MISTFTGIETALRGLLAQQQALDVTGHNIANANTVGYSRQTTELATSTPLQVAPGLLLGTGVDVASYARIRDSFLDVQLRAQTMLQGAADATKDGLGQVESVLNEPSDSGLNSLLGQYWSAWQNVADSPEDPATRQTLVEAAKSLAGGFNMLASQLQTITSQTAQNAQLTLAQANADGGDLQKLNVAIYGAVAGGNTPNDLLDQRDQVLDKLSQLGNVSVTDNGDGTIKVLFDGVTLVDGKTLRTVSESGGTISNDAPTPETATVGATTGKLGALIALRDTTLPGYLSSLDQVANALVTQTNALHTTGTGADGSTGVDFFDPAGTTAATIKVTVTAPEIAASATGDIGDNTNATAIADLATTTLGAPLNATIGGAYAQLVTTIGSDSADAIRASGNSAVLVDSLTSRRESVSGVSLDEEMTNLIKFQQGYQAAARALTTMDDALSLLITRTGRAGL